MLDVVDFITPEFFRSVLREQKSIIIYPYLAPEKLHLFLSMLPPYSIIEMDVSDLDLEDSFEWMIHSHKSTPNDPTALSNKLLFLTNLTATQAKRLAREENIHFIAIVKDPLKEEEIKSEKVLLYNRKTGLFLNYKTKPLESNWFESELVQYIKKTQNQKEIKAFISEKIQKAKEIYEAIILEDSDRLYPIIQELEPTEKDFIKDFLIHYFRITVDSDLFGFVGSHGSQIDKNHQLYVAQCIIKPDSSMLIELQDTTNDNLRLETSEGVRAKESDNFMNIELIQQYKIEKADNESMEQLTKRQKIHNKQKEQRRAISKQEERTKPFVNNSAESRVVDPRPRNNHPQNISKNQVEERYIKELSDIRNPKLGIGQIFDYCLDSMRYLNSYKNILDPQSLYIALRNSKWNTRIPTQFLLEMYRSKINAIIKSFPNLSREDYILILEENKDNLLIALKNVPKAEDFDDELETYIQRIIKQKEFHEIRQEMKENIQEIKSSFIEHINQKYQSHHIDIIPSNKKSINQLTTSHETKYMDKNEQSFKNKPNDRNKNIKNIQSQPIEHIKKHPKRGFNPNLESFSGEVEHINEDPKHQQSEKRVNELVPELSKDQQNIHNIFSPFNQELKLSEKKQKKIMDSINRLNSVMDNLELCLKYIQKKNQNKELVVQ